MAKPEKENGTVHNLGAVLKAIRQKRDIDQRTLAAEIGTSASTICRIEQGYLPDVTTWQAITNWLLSGPVQAAAEGAK